MDNKFTWVPIYKELAQKLLLFKANRKPLVDWIYSNLGDIKSGDKPLIGFIHEKNGDKISDIDPFSVYAIFNRGITYDNRREFISRFKLFLSLKSNVPTDFDGIPVMNSQRSFFFSWYSDKHEVNETYWTMLEKALSGERFEKEFNALIDRGGIKYSLTMALFWILPDRYLALDSNNRNYIKKAGINVDNCPHYEEYLDILQTVQSKMNSSVLPHNSFTELSYQAWQEKSDNSNSSNSSDVWMWLADEDTFKSDRIGMGKTVSSGIRDYSQFKTYNSMRDAYQKVRGNTDVSIPYAYWQFITQVKPGDFVVAFKNKRVANKNHHMLLGWGTFTSELINDVDSESPLQRKVKWHTPLPSAPIEDALTHDSLFFHATTSKQAVNIKSLLGIGDEMTISVAEDRKFWLVGYSYGEYGSQYDRFIENNVWEGNGPKAVNDRIESFRKGDVLILKATSTKGKKHDQPFLRIKNVAVVESEKAELMPDTNYTLKVKYLDVPETDFDGSKYGKYRQTVHLCDNQEIINYVSQYLNSDGMEKKTSKYPEYIKLLKNCRNLILTGAPGTGKTYMAREIAEEMGECEFVQFHPSFDYTDFVEGLRPIKDENGQLGFERRDGIFKAFCKRALKNLRDSERSQKDLEYSADITNRLNEFLNDAIENERSFKTATGTKFFISSFENGLLSIRIPDNDKANQLKVKISQISDILENNVELNKVYDIRDYFGQQFGTQQNSYIFVICKEVRKYKTQSNIKVDAEKRKDFVFVVDEINRGNLSKIFGELFFSLDPGYRGVKGLVKTQYQNLVDEDDVFAKGFFIPENVYLIGTMNDIDRSVESMDFAMRRRFTWKEIAPEDRIGMWGNATWKDAADERMSSLNKAISEIRGLGVEYSIGPSYFLKLNDNGADFENLWEMNLKFLLSEYLRGFADKNDLIEKLHKAYQLES